jgi:hypothetical protein
VHQDLAQLDALTHVTERCLHSLTAGDDGHSTDASCEVNAYVPMACAPHMHTCTAEFQARIWLCASQASSWQAGMWAIRV